MVSGSSGIVGGGEFNVASGDFSVVVGGFFNKARGKLSFVGGGGGWENITSFGDSNVAVGDYSTIGGGLHNIINNGGLWSTIGGGIGNTANDTATTVSGGFYNFATGNGATVAGGLDDTASNSWSTVSGGILNAAFGIGATIAGGHRNRAGGSHAFIAGGSENVANGVVSFSAGTRARALHDQTFVWSDHDDGVSYFTSTAPHQFLIRATGGVGIGTNSPSNQLSVLGNVDFSGNVGIGTTTPSTDLEVNGDIRLSGSNPLQLLGPAETIRFDSPTLGPAPGMLFTAHSTRNFVFGTYDGATYSGTRMMVDGGGNVSITGVMSAAGCVCPSDARLKKNITPLTGVLEKLQSIHGVKFDWIEQSREVTENGQVGVLAQELEKEFPELVVKNNDDYLSVDYGKFTAVLLEAIKEQQKEIAELQIKIENLEKKNRKAIIEN
jgi:hypothetical protein